MSNESVDDELIPSIVMLEHLKERLSTLNRADTVDIGARLGGMKRDCEALDKTIKQSIKQWRRYKEGVVLGSIFRARLVIVPVTRLNQEKLKELHPKIFSQCQETEDEIRILYEVR